MGEIGCRIRYNRAKRIQRYAKEAAMNFLAPITHPMFERFYKRFDHIFSEPTQRRNFRLYCSGLTLEIKRKNIWYMNEHIIGSDYQPMQHFMSDAPWPENALNDQRTDILEGNPATKSCDDGYSIIDDTGNQALRKLEQKESEKSFLSPKSGDSTHATSRQWLGSLGKVDRGQVVVTSHYADSRYADSRKDWPIDHRPYLPQKWVEGENQRLDKEVYVFKSKLQLGLELVDDLLRRGIQFFHFSSICW